MILAMVPASGAVFSVLMATITQGKFSAGHMFAHKMLDGMDSDVEGQRSKECVAGHHRQMRERRQRRHEKRAGSPEGNCA